MSVREASNILVICHIFVDGAFFIKKLPELTMFMLVLGLPSPNNNSLGKIGSTKTHGKRRARNAKEPFLADHSASTLEFCFGLSQKNHKMCSLVRRFAGAQKNSSLRPFSWDSGRPGLAGTKAGTEAEGAPQPAIHHSWKRHSAQGARASRQLHWTTKEAILKLTMGKTNVENRVLSKKSTPVRYLSGSRKSTFAISFSLRKYPSTWE